MNDLRRITMSQVEEATQEFLSRHWNMEKLGNKDLSHRWAAIVSVETYPAVTNKAAVRW